MGLRTPFRRLISVGVFAALVVARVMPAQAQLVVTLWHPWQGAPAQVLARWLADYEASHEGRVVIQAEYVPFFALLNRFSAPPDGQARPDMVLGPSDWAGTLVNRRLVAQLEGRLNPTYRAQVTVAWGAVHYDTHIVGMPISLEGPAFYANRALLGDEPPPATLDDLLRAAAAHATGDQPGLIMGSDFYPTAGIFFALGGQLADAAGSSLLREGDALPAYLTSLQDLHRRAQDGYIALDAPSDAFREGRVPFMLGGSWQLAELRAALGDSLLVAPLPEVNGQPWAPLVRTWNLYMSLDSLRIEGAMEFARFVTSEAAQALAAREGALVPVNSAAWAADPGVRAIAEGLDQAGVPIPTRPEMEAYWEPLRAMIRAATDGGQDAETAALAAQDAVDLAIDAWRRARR